MNHLLAEFLVEILILLQIQRSRGLIQRSHDPTEEAIPSNLGQVCRRWCDGEDVTGAFFYYILTFPSTVHYQYKPRLHS